ncbi:MAG: hypothetical protein AAB358_01780 [Patescibacteria group bacterium]
MGKPKSEFLQAFGKAFQVFKALADEVLAAGGSDDDLRLLETDKNLKQRVAEMIITTRKVAEIFTAQTARQAAEEASRYVAGKYNLVIDYTQSLADIITAGKYDRENPDITAEHFPITGTGKQEVTVELLHFNRHFNNGDEVLAEIDKLGYRPAKIEELLALGAAQPELQRQFPIGALGSTWRSAVGGRRFACLDGGSARRVLDLGWLGDDFYDFWRFAAVRKPARNASHSEAGGQS